MNIVDILCYPADIGGLRCEKSFDRGWWYSGGQEILGEYAYVSLHEFVSAVSRVSGWPRKCRGATLTAGGTG